MMRMICFERSHISGSPVASCPNQGCVNLISEQNDGNEAISIYISDRFSAFKSENLVFLTLNCMCVVVVNVIFFPVALNCN